MEVAVALQIMDWLLRVGQFAADQYAKAQEVRGKIAAVQAEGRDFTDAELEEISAITNAQIAEAEAIVQKDAETAKDEDDGA